MKDINILLNNGVNLNKSLELFGDQETYDETLEEFLNGVNEKIKLIIPMLKEIVKNIRYTR